MCQLRAAGQVRWALTPRACLGDRQARIQWRCYRQTAQRRQLKQSFEALPFENARWLRRVVEREDELLWLRRARLARNVIPIKAAAASTAIAYGTGAAATVAGSVLVRITVTTAVMLTISADIDKAAAGGYMSTMKARAYAEKINNLPYHKQLKIQADVLDVQAHMVEH